MLWLAFAGPVAAHEFWLEPEDFHLEAGDRLVANGKVGQTLEGEVLGYYPEATVHFDLTRGADSAPVTGAVGQIPAVDMAVLGPGLNVLRFQSSNYQVTHETLADFASFLEDWDQEWAMQTHLDNDLPQTGIREVFFRYAKALVEVGDGAGDDRALGMPLELVALDNPYAATGPIELELRLKGEPLADGSVKVFRRAPDGAVTVAPLRTDARGRFAAPGEPGLYLVNAVYLDLASERMQMFLGASWQSLWASMTYELE
jgi:hypothetical protein